MTKHRKPEEWIEDILEAAANEISENGYSKLTMESIVAKTNLSKGGVYRFFSNKREVAIALFTKHYRALLNFDIEEVVAWNLSIPDTLYRLIFEPWEADEFHRDQKVWVQLISETVTDKGFVTERKKYHERLTHKFRLLIERILERDCLKVRTDAALKVETALLLGSALMEGLTIQGISGTSLREQAGLVRRFIEVALSDGLEE